MNPRANTSDRRYVWAGGNQPAEERDATTNAVTKRFFEEGEQRIGGADAGFYYYAKDHLGSVREITNASGAIAARYDFDLWDKRQKLSGVFETEVGYTGHHHHAKSGLVMTWYRAYDAELGRWLSADPIGEEGGLNLYGYVGNDPINGWDPLGLEPCAKNQNKPGKEASKWISNILKSLKYIAGEGIKHARSPGPGFGKVVGPIDTGVKTLEIVPDAVRLLGHEKMRQRLFDSDFDSEDLEKYDKRKWQDGYKKCK